MTTHQPDAAALFHHLFGRLPDGVASAPGRVNLIGEHTDYNGGLVLPFAIDARAQVAVAPRHDAVVRVVSAQRPSEQDFRIEKLRAGSAAGRTWAGYVVGVVWALAESGYPVSGLDIAVDSAVPSGAGVSSSAALECATALAVSELTGLGLSGPQLARVAQLAENQFVGVPSGLMDQMASCCCRAGHLLLFDVGADRTEHIPFDPATHGLALLLIDTRVHHSLADGEYAKRRAGCERAARELGVDDLTHVTDLDAALAGLADSSLAGLVRHVVTENDRVRATVALLRSDDVAGIGPLLTASHTSLAGDFQVSCDELDLAVRAVLDAGALGARMTGGGFGGSVIALVPADSVDRVGQAVTDAFARTGYTEPVLRTVVPADGARREG